MNHKKVWRSRKKPWRSRVFPYTIGDYFQLFIWTALGWQSVLTELISGSWDWENISFIWRKCEPTSLNSPLNSWVVYKFICCRSRLWNTCAIDIPYMTSWDFYMTRLPRVAVQWELSMDESVKSDVEDRLFKALCRVLRHDLNKSHITWNRIAQTYKTANLYRVSKQALGSDWRRDSDSPSYTVWVIGFQGIKCDVFESRLKTRRFEQAALRIHPSGFKMPICLSLLDVLTE